MAIDSNNNIIYDFLTEPKFRLRRSVLLLLCLLAVRLDIYFLYLRNGLNRSDILYI